MLNRFPKMVFLWEAVAKDKLGLEPRMALCIGYAVATVYAILKNKGMHAVKDNHEKASASVSQSQGYKTIDIPGKHPSFLKKLPYRWTKDGLEFLVAGEWQNLSRKTFGFLKRFTPDQIDRLRAYARKVLGVIESYGFDNWFEVWKAYRDKDWLEEEVALSRK